MSSVAETYLAKNRHFTNNRIVAVRLLASVILLDCKLHFDIFWHSNLMRLIKMLAVMLIVPIIGAVLGFVVGTIFLPPDPSGLGSPGDGFLLIFSTGVGFAGFCLGAVLLAFRIWRRSTSSAKAH